MSTVVCDASALVALLVDGGADGEWATEHLSGSTISAPHLASFETANILRRQELAGVLEAGHTAQAHADLLDLAIELWSYEPLAPRAWELRANLSAYDAAYVALAEMLGAPLVTLDRKIARAPGVRCTVDYPGRSPSQ